MKEKPKKRPVKGTVKHKKIEKKLITGQTEVMDFDLEEELRLREERKAARKAARAAANEAEKKGQDLSKKAVKTVEIEEESVEEPAAVNEKSAADSISANDRAVAESAAEKKTAEKHHSRPVISNFITLQGILKNPEQSQHF